MGMIIQADVISLTRATGLGRLRRTSDAPALFGNGGASSLATEPRAQFGLHNPRACRPPQLHSAFSVSSRMLPEQFGGGMKDCQCLPSALGKWPFSVHSSTHCPEIRCIAAQNIH